MLLRKLAVVPILLLVLFSAAPGCGKKDSGVTFNPVPEGTPTVGASGAPVAKKAKPVEDK